MSEDALIATHCAARVAHANRTSSGIVGSL